MTSNESRLALIRTRWSAIGAAIAITLGAGGIGLAQASVTSGDKPVTVTVNARRILDTRTNVGLAGGFTKDTPREVQVTGSVDVVTDTGTTKETVVPAGASAVLVNVTVVFPTDQGFLTLRSGGATGAPKTSTVNFAAGSVEPNAATVDLSADGKIQVWVFMPSATAKTDVLIDVVGYTTDHDHDDRYYTKAQSDAAVAAAVAPKANSADVYTKSQVDGLVPATEQALTLSGWDFHGAEVDVMRYGNGGCGYNNSGGALRGSAQLPVGATITGMTATVVDNSGSDAFLDLLVFEGAGTVLVGSLTTAGTSGLTNGVVGTVTPTIVGPSGHVILVFGPITSVARQICGVQIQYDRP